MGARAKENEKDVKDTYPTGVDNTSPTSGGKQDSRQLNIGTQQSAVGEDPSVEDNYKGDKEDPGTDHPANAEEVGDKYASVSTENLVKRAYALMNECLADMANGETVKEAGVSAASLAAQAGYELAAAAGQGDTQYQAEKRAFVQNFTETMLNDARHDADLVGRYLTSYHNEKVAAMKRAEGPSPEELAMAGGPPPGPGGPGGDIPPDIMQAMAGGGGGGMPPEMGGSPEVPPEEAGEIPGGPGGEEAAINELANALIEAGINPEELLAAVQDEVSGGGGGGMPPDSPEAKQAAANRRRIPAEDRKQIRKLASDVRNLYRKGRVRLKEASPGSRLRQERDEVINYVREVCGR
jgi:hypothetical protein